MLELEDNKHELAELKQKIDNLGDSLWHFWFVRKNKRIRETSLSRRILG
jgi:hypothetical protein